MRTKVSGFVLALLLTGALIGQQNKQAEIDLQAAIRTENVNGDLKAAIKQYEAIASKYAKSDRATAVNALVRMGNAYQRMGDAQSRKIYEQIVTDYPDQKEAVKFAKARLGGPLPDALTARLVLNTVEPGLPTISKDGQWLAMRPRFNANDDLVLQNTATGLIRRLDLGRALGTSGDDCPTVFRAILSPDAQQVAYSCPQRLRVIANQNGAKPRTLLATDSRSGFAAPMDWSPDGKSILVLLTKGAVETIAWISLNDGRLKIVKSHDAARLRGDLRLSPDGKFIVYAAGVGNTSKAPASENVDIYVLAVDGSIETRLTTANINEDPLWSEDGSHILFISNRSGDRGLWSIAVRNGNATGDSVLLKKDMGTIIPVGISRSGSYYYVQEKTINASGTNIFEAEVDPASGRQLSQTKILSENSVGWNNAPTWSPDGKSIAFKRRHKGNAQVRDLIVRSVESGEETAYTAPDWTNVNNGFGPGAPKWLHGGSGLFVGDEPILGQQRWLGRMDLKGQFTRLVQIGPELGWVATLSPDDKTAYVYSRRGNSPNGTYMGLVGVDLVTGEKKGVFTAPSNATVNSAVVSSDGRTLALFVFANAGGRSDTTLAMIGSDGGKYRALYVTEKPIATTPDQIQWANDGRALFFVEDGRWMRLGLPNGSPEFTGLSMSRPDRGHPISLRGDGSRVVFSDGAPFEAAPMELWALDNLKSISR